MEGPRWLIIGLTVLVAIAVLALVSVAAMAAVVVLEHDDSKVDAVHGFAEGPVQAILDLDSSGKEKWASTLGEGCNLDKVYVLALGQSPDGVDVVSFPGDCDVNRFHVSWDDGGVRPEDPLQLEESPQ